MKMDNANASKTLKELMVSARELALFTKEETKMDNANAFQDTLKETTHYASQSIAQEEQPLTKKELIAFLPARLTKFSSTTNVYADTDSTDRIAMVNV